MALDHRAHGTVQDQDALGHQGPEQGGIVAWHGGTGVCYGKRRIIQHRGNADSDIRCSKKANKSQSANYKQL
jgi:hypothetical protein